MTVKEWKATGLNSQCVEKPELWLPHDSFVQRLVCAEISEHCTMEGKSKTSSEIHGVWWLFRMKEVLLWDRYSSDNPLSKKEAWGLREEVVILTLGAEKRAK